MALAAIGWNTEPFKNWLPVTGRLDAQIVYKIIFHGLTSPTG
jgi:hypothetical protein